MSTSRFSTFRQTRPGVDDIHHNVAEALYGTLPRPSLEGGAGPASRGLQRPRRSSSGSTRPPWPSSPLPATGSGLHAAGLAALHAAGLAALNAAVPQQAQVPRIHRRRGQRQVLGIKLSGIPGGQLPARPLRRPQVRPPRRLEARLRRRRQHPRRAPSGVISHAPSGVISHAPSGVIFGRLLAEPGLPIALEAADPHIRAVDKQSQSRGARPTIVKQSQSRGARPTTRPSKQHSYKKFQVSRPHLQAVSHGQDGHSQQVASSTPYMCFMYRHLCIAHAMIASTMIAALSVVPSGLLGGAVWPATLPRLFRLAIQSTSSVPVPL